MAGATKIPADMAVSPKFSDFNLVDVHYKEVKGTPVPASILIPKNIKSGKHPVIVRWHGGCFITGHRLYPEWFPSWVLQFALSKEAVIISPDYRLMPEVTGLDILQDVRDFYNWLATPQALDSYLSTGVSADSEHILITGESAGGWLALQSEMLVAPRERIAACISEYPMIDLRAPWYTGDYEKQLFTPTAPQLDRSILRDYLASVNHDTVITSAVPPDRVPIVISSLQQGVFGQIFGDHSALYPIEALENLTDLPPTWILHGKGDTVIPIEGSYKYEKALKEKLPSAKLHVSYQEGEDHGFDNSESVNLETDWVVDGVKFIQQFWPNL